MRYLLLLVLALVAAVGLGQLLQQDPGFIIVGYGGKFYRMSFVPFVVVSIVAAIALYLAVKLLLRLLTIGRSWNDWTSGRRRRRSQKSLNSGLIALAEGDYARAEQMLKRGADDDISPAVHYLGAAEAAQGLNATDRRDRYLAKAREALPSAEPAIGIKRAEMQIETGQLEQAQATVAYLADRYPDNPQVLLLKRDLCLHDHDWQGLATLLPALRRHRALDEASLSRLEVDTGRKLVDRYISSRDELDVVWQKLPRRARESASCIAAYARQLVVFGDHENAEATLRKALNQNWNAELIALYREVELPNTELLLERAEAWLKQRPDDPDLLVTVAALAAKAERYTEARTHLEKLNAFEYTPQAYQLLADIYEKEGQLAEASRCRREGLKLAIGSSALEHSKLPIALNVADG